MINDLGEPQDKVIVPFYLANDYTSSERQAINTIGYLCQEAYINSRAHGFWDTPDRNKGEMIALMHSELSEVLEDLRTGNIALSFSPNGKPEGLPSELADVLVRIFDFCGGFDIDLADALITKMRYNVTRPHKHGRAF